MGSRPLITKIWSLCGLLRDDGITYQDYLTELSWLLYLCFANQSRFSVNDAGTADVWNALLGEPEDTVLLAYTGHLSWLARSSDKVTSEVFAGARTKITDARVLAALIKEIDRIAWDQFSPQALGDIYEGILERNAQEQKSGAGQYFTPRSVVNLMVRVISPGPGEVVQDPAAGTGGFLVAAAAHAQQNQEEGIRIVKDHSRKPTYFGIELVPDAFRLCLMNLSLHSIPSEIRLGSALGLLGTTLPRPDIILTNPPFGSRRGADRIERPDLNYQTSNKQLAFLQHVYHALRAGGRAAIIVPDGVLFDGGVARDIRRELLQLCNVHTILRLPVGLFYAQAVKTNVLFFEKPATRRADSDATERIWIYDARAGLSARTQAPKTAAVFADFEYLYSLDGSDRSDMEATHPRLASFSRTDVEDHDDRLDLPIGRANTESDSGYSDPRKAVNDLRLALTEALLLVDELESNLTNGET